jgi:hypothetical protein
MPSAKYYRQQVDRCSRLAAEISSEAALLLMSLARCYTDLAVAGPRPRGNQVELP